MRATLIVILTFLIAGSIYWLSLDGRQVTKRGSETPSTLAYPEHLVEELEIRKFPERNNPWVEANQADTSRPGIYEIKHTGQGVAHLTTPEATELAQKAFSAAKSNGWFDYSQGTIDGFRLANKIDPLHYFKPDYIDDGDTLNPEKPEALMYYPTPKGMVLAGVMFLAEGVDEIPTQLGVSGAYWHFHRWTEEICWQTLPSGPVKDGRCPNGHTKGDQSPLMLHVWFVDHPDGIFGTDMCLPGEVLDGFEGTAALQFAHEQRTVIEITQERIRRQHASDLDSKAR